VLFVGQHPGDARLLKELLNASPADRFELETIEQPRAALERLRRGDIDVALLDVSLPRGLEALSELAAARPAAPYLVLSAVEDERLELQAVRAGAEDFLVKGRLDSQVLVHAIRYAIERHRLRSDLRDLSLLDELTGLYNRRGFVTLATQDVRIARRAKQPLLLAFGDVDDLKRINDTLGHAQGDEALRDVGRVLRRTFRDSDLIARIGGDEFAVLVRSADANSVDVLQRRLNEQLQHFTRRAKRRYTLDISLGFAYRAATSVASVENLLRAADRALYREKRRRDAESRAGAAAPAGGVVQRRDEARPIDILLVEDDPQDVELTRRALRQSKLQNRMSVVADGVEALAFLRGETPFEETPPPDVVLLDLKLPKKDGREVLHEMRQDPHLRDIPVVILTATDAKHAQLEALHPDAFLTKPVDFARLAQAVRSVASLGFTIVRLPIEAP
jgi:diguanylate cyclase (GGDEF)-like protein